MSNQVTPSIVYDDTNWKQLLGPTHDEQLPDGSVVPVRMEGGQKRFLSRVPTQSGRHFMASLPRFRDAFPVIPRSDWDAMIDEKDAKKTWVDDYQWFAPHDQDGLPTCWANGPAHAGTTRRVMDGLPLVYLSACSAAQPISGGHSGGDEADAGEYFQKYGAASVDVWPNNSTQSLSSDPKVQESRLHHKFYQVYSLHGFDEFATAMLLSFPMAVAFNWWSHVISGGRLLKGYKACYRNNWGDWGDKNRLGQPGYITMVEGHGTPDSGFCIGPLTMSTT
jgi:hypothetical protein